MTPPDLQELRAARRSGALGDAELDGLFTTPTPSRRDAGAVYTPRWLADCLAARVVGPLDDVRRVLDPACGAGALLVAVYRHLRDRARPTPGPGARASLVSRMVGVDADPAAVERALAYLLAAATEPGDPASWDAAPVVTHGDGLEDALPEADVVVANPPWVRMQDLVRTRPTDVARWSTRWRSAAHGNWDLASLFAERVLGLAGAGGRFGLVLPSRWLTLDAGRGLRQVLAACRQAEVVVHFGDAQLFPEATTYTCLLIGGATRTRHLSWESVDDPEAWSRGVPGSRTTVAWEALDVCPWHVQPPRVADLLAHLADAGPPLEASVDRIYQGLATSADRVYVGEVCQRSAGRVRLWSRHLEREVELEDAFLAPFMTGSDVTRLGRADAGRVVLLPYREGELVPWDDLAARAPQTARYLEACRPRLLARRAVDPARWWGYPYPKNLRRFGAPKLLAKVLATRASFAIDPVGGVCFAGGGTAGANGVAVDDPERLWTLHGILNSDVCTAWVRWGPASTFRGGYRVFSKATLADLPVPDGPSARRVAGEARRLAAGEGSEEALEEAVADLYGLDPSQRRTLRAIVSDTRHE